MRGLPESS